MNNISNIRVDLNNKMVFERATKEYAKLVIEMGIRVKKGQTLVIESEVDGADFVRKCVDAAYDAGASEVLVSWSDEYCGQQRVARSSMDALGNYPVHLKELYNYYADKDAAFLRVLSPISFLDLKIATERLVKTAQTRIKATEKFTKAEKSNKIAWCAVGAPNKEWAKKVYPYKSEEEALRLLWEAVLKTVYVNGDGKSIERWNQHLRDLKRREQILNDYRFKSLHYTNNLGTDLTLCLPENHVWASASDETVYGQVFIANMPTEEIFCCPAKHNVDGVVYSAKPLVMDGVTFNDLKFTLKDGKIVEVVAKDNQRMMETKLDTDAGARFLGEVALVPYDSTISKMNTIFYNTLYDENASCHLAFGFAYPGSVEGGPSMTPEQLEKANVNHSNVHIDFMIGTKDLNITGITGAGEEVQIFKNGNFVF